MTIAGVATAFPDNRYDHGALREAFPPGVKTQHFSLPLEGYYRLKSWGAASDHWIQTAQEIGQKALSEALARASLTMSDLSVLFFVSIAGASGASFEARLMNCMGLPANMKHTPVFGLGCAGGAAAISRAADHVQTFPNEIAAVLAVELCPLALQQDDVSTADATSAARFGEGAGAVLVAGAERRSEGPRILATRSLFYPDSEDALGWHTSGKGFQLVLSSEVPEVVQEHLATDVDIFLDDQALSRRDIGSWVLHTGGPRVLEGTAAVLGLSREDLETSWNCLSEAGNLSSASVLAVLEEVLMNRRPADGACSLLVAMGPGFCCELVLMKW